VDGAALISVIVTTYDREDALDAVLRALSRQTDRDFEIVIADDGSGLPTHTFVTRIAVSAAARSATAASSPAQAGSASFSTAIACPTPILSRPIAHSPSQAGSSPATAFCCPAS
jgi:GT2 family glycosyltransferase